MRDYLASKTASFLVNKLDDKDYENLSLLLSKKKKADYVLKSKDQIKDIFEYAFKSLYGEGAKTIIIFTIAYLMNMLLPVALITLTFATLRTVAGGVHMDSFTKCLISSMLLILIPGYFVSQLSLSYTAVNYIIFITSIYSVIIAYKYAPRDTITKIINDPVEIKKLKIKTMIYLSFMISGLNTLNIISRYEGYNTQLVVVSICTGMILEMFTITPVGVRIFHYIRDLANRIGEKKECC